MDDYQAVDLNSRMSPFTPKARPNNKFYRAKEAEPYTKYDYTYSEVRPYSFCAEKPAGYISTHIPDPLPTSCIMSRSPRRRAPWA
jgi:hypothetical protein